MYYGTETGATTNYDHAFNMMKYRSQLFSSFGLYLATGACYDPRELHRGPISQEAFFAALDTLPGKTMVTLNTLWRQNPAYWSNSTLVILDSGEDETLTAVQTFEKQHHLVVINFTAAVKMVLISVPGLEPFFGAVSGDASFLNVTSGERRTFNKSLTSYSLECTLCPYEFGLLKLAQ